MISVCYLLFNEKLAHYNCLNFKRKPYYNLKGLANNRIFQFFN